jgi:putative ABC transport system substrate-binding protein
MGSGAFRHDRRRLLRSSLTLASVSLLAGCVIDPPWAQQPAKVPRIGYLAAGLAPPPNTPSLFVQALRDLGHEEGRTVHIEWRYAQDDAGRLPALAAELVDMSPDLIVAAAEQAARAAKGVTASIPVVFTGVGDPVSTGLVESIRRPGGNMTGVVYIPPELSTKRLELLKQTAPRITRVAILTGLVNPSQPLMEKAGPALGVQLDFMRLGNVADLERAFETIIGSGADALLVSSEGLLTSQRARLIDFAARQHTPAIYAARTFVADGGLMSYAPDLVDLNRRAAMLVDKILRGARPADLPVEYPTKFDFVVNVKAAQALALAIPEPILRQATELIE